MNGLSQIFRVMDHPDRAPGPVTTRKMTEEERKKYGLIEVKKPDRICIEGACRTGKMLKITNKQLEEEVKRLGTGREAYREIAKKYNMSWTTVKNRAQKQDLHKRYKGVVQMPEKSKLLKPVVLKGESYMYHLEGDVVKIKDQGNTGLEIYDIDKFIAELEEIKSNQG